MPSSASGQKSQTTLVCQNKSLTGLILSMKMLKEVILDDVHESLGNWVTLTYFVDANLYYNMITGCSVIGILHLTNKTPID